MDLGLKNKVALVTGASKGLGYATAKQLAMEGAKVVINSRNKDKLSQAESNLAKISRQSIKAIAGDVTSSIFVLELIKETIQSMGGLDILITNCGGPPPGGFEDLKEADWQTAFESTFLSHLRLIQAALPYLKKSKTPSVLTITSYSVKQPIPNLILSNTIRAATAALSKSLSVELGKYGIRFNSILPGWTDTERVHDLLEARAIKYGTSIEDEIAKQTAENPLGRLGKPSEFANAAVFLVSPAASFINGVLLNVDGGLTKAFL